jgi:hypothetical protein
MLLLKKGRKGRQDGHDTRTGRSILEWWISAIIFCRKADIGRDGNNWFFVFLLSMWHGRTEWGDIERLMTVHTATMRRRIASISDPPTHPQTTTNLIERCRKSYQSL